MEANITISLFKEPTNVQVIENIDINIDLIMLMSTIIKNYL